jgi:hypothetical protein
MRPNQPGFRKPRKAKLASPSKSMADRLEARTLLAAAVAPADPVIFGNTVTAPLVPRPGHTFYVAGFDSTGTTIADWANASAITPNTTNDLVLNVAPASTNYVACCEGAGGTLGANLLTNGITQTQTAPAPSANQPAVGDGGASDPSGNANTISDLVRDQYFFTYNLGTAGGATPSANGYDLSEIDVITGHHDSRTRVVLVDVLVEPIGSNQFLSLSGGQGFSLTSVPDGMGGTTQFANGSAQMAIANVMAGQPLAQHIQAVKFSVLDSSSFFRELVVTGTASASGLSSAPPTPTAVAAAYGSGNANVSWAASAGAVGYTIMRSTTVNGTYTSVGSVVGQTSFVDGTIQPNTTYYYEVAASGKGDSAASNPSAALATPNFGATAYIFQNQLWQGAPTITENVPQINYSGAEHSSQFPLMPGFVAGAFSAFIQGKVTTDLAGMYTFVVSTDDDGYLWVDGQLVSSNPGLAVAGRSPGVNIPISLAANTAYDFVFLENNRVGSWSMNMSWQEPTAGGTAGPLTVIPATRLTPNVDAPPVPARPTGTTTAANGTVQLAWSPTGDASSYGYVIERAISDVHGDPIDQFLVLGQVFSGPTVVGAAGTAAWGASSFTDTTASTGSTYVYRIGTILPGQSTPASFSPDSPPIQPGVQSAGGSSVTPALGGALPSSTIAGQKLNATQTVTLTAGPKSVSGTVKIALYLDTGTGVDAGAILLQSTSKRLKLKANGRLSTKLKILQLPASVPNGTYHVVVQVTDPAGVTSDAASAGTITVAPPQIDLAGAFSKTPVPGKGGKTVLTLNVSNMGNSAAAAALTFNVDRSPDGQLSDATVITTSTKKINLKPQKSTKIVDAVVLPAGAYFMVIQLDPSDAFKDINLANDVFASSSQVTVG